MRIQVNGETRDVPDNVTLWQLIAYLGQPAERIAIEVNERVVRRAEWSSTELTESDHVEIVHFVGGGFVSSCVNVEVQALNSKLILSGQVFRFAFRVLKSLQSKAKVFAQCPLQ